MGHCEEPLATKQSQATNKIATPFGLAMTIPGETKCKLFHAPLSKLGVFSSEFGVTYFQLYLFRRTRKLQTHQSTYPWPAIRSFSVAWRRERDLNPRSRFKRDTRLAGEPLRPLGHLSVIFLNAMRISLSD